MEGQERIMGFCLIRASRNQHLDYHADMRQAVLVSLETLLSTFQAKRHSFKH